MGFKINNFCIKHFYFEIKPKVLHHYKEKYHQTKMFIALCHFLTFLSYKVSVHIIRKKKIEKHYKYNSFRINNHEL